MNYFGVIFLTLMCFVQWTGAAIDECYFCSPQYEGEDCKNFSTTNIKSKPCENDEFEHHVGIVQRVQSKFFPNSDNGIVNRSCVSYFLNSETENATGVYRFCVSLPRDSACEQLKGESELGGKMGQCVACDERNICNNHLISDKDSATGIKSSLTLVTLFTSCLVIIMKLSM